MLKRIVLAAFLVTGASLASPRPEPLGAFTCEWCESSNWYCLAGVGHVCKSGGVSDRWCFDWPEHQCDIYPASLDGLDAGGAPLSAPRYMAEGEDARRSCDDAVLRFHLDDEERRAIHDAAAALTV